MYINDTYIGFYIMAAIIGLAVGQFADWIKERLPENKKVFSGDIIRRYKIDFKPNYPLMLVTSAIYILLMYNFGMQRNFIGSLNLIKNLILTPMLLAAFAIDYKRQIIPNRLNLTIFETGLVIAFLYGISNIAITIDMLFGMIAGIVIFLIITLIGGLIYGKDSMGLGDIKFIGALGLYFGLTKITAISIIAFLIGAIIGIILIISKRKKADEYIPFGPFIVIAAFICMLVPFETIMTALKLIFTFKI